MTKHIEQTQSQLGELHGLSAKTEAAEQRILSAAIKRLDVVNAAIERARPGVEGAPDNAQDRYVALVNERGQLNLVIAKAKRALGQA
jgi:CHAD domain-containing protein